MDSVEIRSKYNFVKFAREELCWNKFRKNKSKWETFVSQEVLDCEEGSRLISAFLLLQNFRQFTQSFSSSVYLTEKLV